MTMLELGDVTAIDLKISLASMTTAPEKFVVCSKTNAFQNFSFLMAFVSQGFNQLQTMM